MGIREGTTIGLIKGDTRSVDSGSCEWINPLNPKPLNPKPYLPYIPSCEWLLF